MFKQIEKKVRSKFLEKNLKLINLKFSLLHNLRFVYKKIRKEKYRKEKNGQSTNETLKEKKLLIFSVFRR